MYHLTIQQGERVNSGTLLRLAVGRNLKAKEMDKRWYEGGNGVKGNR